MSEKNPILIDLDSCREDLHRPIVLSNIRGTYDRPVVVICKSTISINTFGIDPAKAANRIACLRQENGFYPSVGQVSDQAALALINCQFVVLRHLNFDQCWPGSLDLNNCQNIVVCDCKFGACTIAIGANGNDTRDIWVERCTFNQTPKRHLWDTIEWRQVHGSYANSTAGGVQKGDQRQFDGDFFRAWNIIGNVTIRDCDIIDAFNGIHFFNSLDNLSPDENRSLSRFNNGRRSASNVLIENNRFVRIRDNCIEPEDHAWNWVVRSNTFDNCYAPYSFELKRAGWFYIYDNHHWIPDPATIGARIHNSGFKLGGAQQNEGDFYIFNNSWLFEDDERLFRKKTLGRMKHFNNAVRWKKKHGRLFGSGWMKPGGTLNDPSIEEKKRFTRRWKNFDIEMNGDWIYGLDGVVWQDYQKAGYALGKNTSNNRPGYLQPTHRPKSRKDQYWLKPSKPMQESGAEWTMRLPGYDEAGKGDKNFQKYYQVLIPAGGGVGAGLTDTRLDLFKKHLRFVPDFPVLPSSVAGNIV
ncbi:MAG: hypothetical protein GY761_17325 [Hyphomicrobiales bacterium]|nr:hypothetical protein [Hyphomicrobiales bacterium]